MRRKAGAATPPASAAAALMMRRRVGAAPAAKSLVMTFPLVDDVVVETFEAGASCTPATIFHPHTKNPIALHRAPDRARHVERTAPASSPVGPVSRCGRDSVRSGTPRAEHPKRAMLKTGPQLSAFSFRASPRPVVSETTSRSCR